MKTDVCPSSKYPKLESKFRKFIHNPQKIFSKYIKPGGSAIDIGCGPGFFTIELAKLVGEKGTVIGTDIQDEAITIINNKIKNTPLEKVVKAVKSSPESIGVTEKLDFILNFYVLHEVKNMKKFIEEIKFMMKPESIYMLVEPKGHVNKNEFAEELDIIKNTGFKLIESPKVFFSRTAVFKLSL
jgi:ubiquinone/menaquinone biosynthesis C-methylase UbiE